MRGILPAFLAALMQWHCITTSGYSREVLELYWERTNSTTYHSSDQLRGALPIQRLEGGRGVERQ